MESDETYNKRQVVGETPLIKKKSDFLRRYSSDGDFVFLIKKTEKIVSALYLVTNFYPNDDPIKRTLRERGIELIDYVVRLLGTNVSNRSDVCALVETRVLEINSLLDVSRASGFISEMNYEVLTTEFFNLLNQVTTDHDSAAGGEHSTTIPASYFSVSRPKPEPSKELYGSGENALVEPNNGAPIPVATRTKNDVIHSQNGVDLSVKSGNKAKRVRLILDMLRKGKELGIKDFVTVIQGFSEKTIQRELLSLVARGVVQKRGERRWSRYSLTK